MHSMDPIDVNGNKRPTFWGQDNTYNSTIEAPRRCTTKYLKDWWLTNIWKITLFNDIYNRLYEV